MKNTLLFSLILVIVLFAPSLAAAQTLEFTYQGKLTAGNAPATGNYDFEFALFDASIGGSQVGAVLTRSGVAVADGVFSVQLNFGNNFFAPNRFLEIRVRPAGGAAFTILTPRQQITSSPFSIVSVNAVNAVNATTATNAEKLGGIAANQFVLTGDARLSDNRNPNPGSSNYIQNTTTTQRGANFNIDGSGAVGGTLSGSIVNAATRFDIGGLRVLSVAGTDNLFAGINAGAANTTGSRNAFFGTSAGQNNTTGFSNLFFGLGAGQNNTTGVGNLFFGVFAGRNNTLGYSNVFIGSGAGFDNTTGNSNSFVGNEAGSNTTTGFSNSFFGAFAGFNNTTGSNNLFIGRSAGQNNTTGSNNTIIGGNVGSGDLSFATAIGASAFVRTNNTIVLGRENGSDRVRIFGLGAAGSTQLCRNVSNEISTCSSSIRYKSNVAGFNSGLSLIRKLRPVSFNWKDNNLADLGLVAEEVNKVEPLLTTVNEKGETEGVKYDRVGVVLINAVQEQQTQIEAQERRNEAQQNQIDEQKELIRKQQAEIEALKQFICSQNPTAEFCKKPN